MKLASRITLVVAALSVLANPVAAQGASIRPSVTALTTRPHASSPSGAAHPTRRVAPFRPIDPASYRAAKAKADRARGSGARTGLTTSTTAIVNSNQAGISAGDESFCCTPPDTTGSIGPNHYVEIVNNLVRVYGRDLNRISDMDLGTFTGTPSGLNTSDPQMQWDAQGNRWFYAAVAFATGNNYVLLGWSKTADPTDLAGGWCHFGLYTANFLQDYPKLGHDNNYLMVGANAYDDSKSGLPFVTATIWVLPKPAVGDASCTAGTSSHFGDANHPLLNADGSTAFTPIPANSTDSSNGGYVVAAHDPTNGPQTKLMVWHVNKTGGGPMLVQDGDLTVQSFAIPPSIPQPGPSLDSLDARLTQAVGHRDPDAGNAEAVWTQHTIGSTSSRAVVRWYELIPSQGSVRQQGELSNTTDYFFNASISPSTLGNDAAIGYNRANAGLIPVVGVVSRTHGDPLNAMGTEQMLGTSAAEDEDLSCRSPYGPPCRWGDYSGMSPDPVNAGVVWGSNQLNGPVVLGFPQWATRNFAVTTTVLPDFGLALSPTGRALTPGNTTTYTVSIADQGNFNGAVTLSVAGLPAGATGTFSTNPATTTSTLTVSTLASTAVGTSQFTVTGVSGSLNHTVRGTLVVNTSSPYASTIMADAPNAYWRLGESSGTVMVDSTANANNGAYSGGVTLNQSGAIVGDGNGAVLLDGSTGHGRAPNSSSLSLTGSMSIETWVMFTATPTSTQDIVNKGDGATAAGTSYMLGYVTGCSNCGLGFYTFIGNGFTCACQASAPAAGKWLHLVGTRTAAGLLNLYVNGSLVASASDGGAALNNVPAGVGIGSTGSGSGSSLYPANATLDETAIYPTALTSAQVSNHFQASGNAGSVPAAPTGVSATAAVNQATVSWTAPSGTVTAYIATAYAGSVAKNSVAVAGTSTSATLYGLQGGTAYTIQVRAFNGSAAGPAGTSNPVTPTGSSTTYTSTILGDGPALYYRLGDPSGTISPDSSNNGNNGIYAGGFTQNQGGGLASDQDRAVKLDGTTGNIRASNSSSLNITGALSVEVWVNWSATPTGTQDLVNKGDGATATGTSYMLGYASCTGCGLGLYTFIGNTFVCACQSSPLPGGQWFHLVGTRTAGGQLTFYVNGKPVASNSDGGAPLNSVPSGLGIGASGSGSGSALLPANATLDEAAVYPTALSATQVASHYQAASASPPAPPSNVVATAGANQAAVSWTAAPGTVTGYIATAFAGSAAKNSIAVGGGATSATITGLQAGTTYTVQVSALNGQATSAAATSNAVAPTGTASTYASTVLGDGPVLYERLGDPSGSVAADSSGNGNLGTYAGGVTMNQPGAIAGDGDGAALLDGVSGDVRVANSSTLNVSGALTLEVWVRWTATATSTQDILNKGDGATASGSAYALAYVPGCQGCGLGFYVFIGNTFVCACQTSGLPAGQWFHLVGTRTASGQLAFYVNGALVATAGDSGAPLNTVSSGLGIGASGSGSGSAQYPANATLDDAAVYPIALTASQVATHYHAAGY